MIALGFSAAMLVAAQQLPDPVEIGSWLVAPADTESCAAVAEFGPNVMVSIRENARGIGSFVLSDDRWQLAEGQVLTGTLSWDNWGTSREARFVAAKTASGRWYLSMPTDGSFTENLAGSRHFWLRVPGVSFDDDFDAANAYEVVSGIAQCNEKLP